MDGWLKPNGQVVVGMSRAEAADLRDLLLLLDEEVLGEPGCVLRSVLYDVLYGETRTD